MAALLRLVHLLALGLWVGSVVYSGSVVLPQASQARFDTLHRRSVFLNGTVLLLGVAAFALAVVQRAPR